MKTFTFGPPISWTFTPPYGVGENTIVIRRGRGYHLLLPYHEHRRHGGLLWPVAMLN